MKLYKQNERQKSRQEPVTRNMLTKYTILHQKSKSRNQKITENKTKREQQETKEMKSINKNRKDKRMRSEI